MACQWVAVSRPTALGRRAVIGLAAFGLTIFGGTAGAAADSDPVGTSPSAGVVAKAPMAVSVTFDKPLRPRGALIRVLGPAGDVGTGTATTSRKTLRRGLRVGAPAGNYLVKWRAVTAAGQRVAGSFSFTAARSNGEPVQTARPLETAAPTPTMIGTETHTTAAAVPMAAPVGPASPSVASSGFTVVPLVFAGLLVLAAGVISLLNKPRATA